MKFGLVLVLLLWFAAACKTHIAHSNNEALLERYRMTKEHQLKTLSEQLEMVESEITKRGLAELSVDKLYNILFRLREAVHEQSGSIIFQRYGLAVPDLETKLESEA